MMKKHFSLLISLVALIAANTALAQDSLWIRYDDRFRANNVVNLSGIDSFVIGNAQLRVGTRTVNVPTDEAAIMFSDPGRILLKPSTYSSTNNCTNSSITSNCTYDST